MTQLADSTLVAHLNAAPDAMVIVDASGEIVLVNAQTEKLFGYGRDELLGKRVEMLVPERFRDQHPGHRMGYVADPHTQPMGVGLELCGRRRDETEFSIEISLSPLETQDGRLVSSAIRDATDRITAEGEKKEAERVRLEAEADHERLEAQLHQSQRMESLGQLARGVAHDFNNLLGVILNYAAFVAEELTSAAATPTGTQWKEPLKDVTQIQLAAERGALLTRQLLSFARREVVQARALSLNSAITRMEQILRRTIGEQIELVISLAASLPMVVADPGQIEQIVLNLAINARDAMPTGAYSRSTRQ